MDVFHIMFEFSVVYNVKRSVFLFLLGFKKLSPPTFVMDKLGEQFSHQHRPIGCLSHTRKGAASSQQFEVTFAASISSSLPSASSR